MNKPEQKNKYYVYDMEELKSIPIETVLSEYNIPLEKGKFKIRDERTPSCKLNPNNTWYDFGSNEGGNVINLIMVLEHKPFKEAVQFMGERYNIPALNLHGEKLDKNRKFLSVTDYENLDLHANPASKNHFAMKRIHNLKHLTYREIQERYSMSMNDLYKKEPNTFENILKQVAVTAIASSYTSYLLSLNIYNSASKNYKPDSVEYKLAESGFFNNQKEYENIFKSYQKAVANTQLENTVNQYKPNFEKDMKEIARKDIEIGDYPYSELKKANLPIVHQKVTFGFFSSLSTKMAIYTEQAGKKPFAISAHIRGETVNLSFFQKDELAIKGMISTVEQVIQNENKQIKAVQEKNKNLAPANDLSL